MKLASDFVPFGRKNEKNIPQFISISLIKLDEKYLKEKNRA